MIKTEDLAKVRGDSPEQKVKSKKNDERSSKEEDG